MKEKFTHMDYRNAKVIHMMQSAEVERYIYKNKEISKEEADEITATHFAEKEKKRMEKQIQEECVR